MADLRLFAGAVGWENGTYSFRFRIDGWPSNFPCQGSDLLEIQPNNDAEHIDRLDAIPGALGNDSHIALATGLKPDKEYKIQLKAEFQPKRNMNNEPEALVIKTPPKALKDSAEGLLIALASCYFPSEQYVGNAQRIKNVLKTRTTPPHLKIFCGDQIYADAPWAALDSKSPEELYRTRYQRAFEPDRLGGLLGWGANVFTCDDHEYWNGFPEAMPYLSRSWNENKALWKKKGCEAFWRNEGVMNLSSLPPLEPQRCWCSYKLAGMDLFVADTRTNRTDRSAPKPCTFSELQRKKLLSWVDNVERVGLLVLGQPLLLQSGEFDNALEDYPDDYKEILELLQKKIVDRGVSFVILTGDIHWGRLVYWVPPRSPHQNRHAKLVEFAASPIARIGLKSILSSEYSVGDPESVNLNPSEYKKFNKHLSGFMDVKVFATNVNNFGLLQLTETKNGHVAARFELLNLDLPWPVTALNQWSNPWSTPLARKEICQHERLLLWNQ